MQSGASGQYHFSKSAKASLAGRPMSGLDHIRRLQYDGRPMTVTAPKQSEARERVLDLIEQLGDRRGDPVRAPAQRRPRRLAADRARRPRRPRPRGLLVRRARQRHVRQRAEDRPGADDDLVHRGHAPARDGARAAGRSSSKSQPAGAMVGPDPPRLAVRAASSSSSACGSPTTRRWRSRRCTCGRRSCPGCRPTTSRATPSTTLLSDRYGIDIVGGLQTIEPTVTNEEESEAARRPAALAGLPVRADDALARRARSSSTSARSIAATATGSSPSSAASPPSLTGQYQQHGFCRHRRRAPVRADCDRDRKWS